jgi:hypothetical protein
MPTNIVCTLNIGRDCIHENARASMREAARRWNCNYLEIVAPAKPGRHHFEEKCLIHKHLPSDGRFLFLDGDIMIRSDCPSPFDIVPKGMLGWVRSHHPNHEGATWHVQRCLPDYARRAGVSIDIEKEYVHSGFMLFELPKHLELFEECQRVIADVGFHTRWELADQGVLTVARKRREIPVFWLPPMFQMAGGCLWCGWTPEMKTFVYHFCGPINKDIAIPRTVWDDLGPDRPISGTSITRWRAGKPIHLTGGDELPMFIRELAQVRRGKIVEVGCYLGGATWYGAQIARDNYSEYHCVDHWQGAADLVVGEEHYRGFVENMNDAGLLEVIQVHRKPSIEAARNFEDGSLSLVFLDGDHSHNACFADIDAWWPKLKPGGVMLGHDYCSKFGVIDAVKQRFGEPNEVSPGAYPIWKVMREL